MKHLRPFLLVLLAATFGLLASACSSRTGRDSSIPWSRPADWEGQVPGMGATPGSGIR